MTWLQSLQARWRRRRVMAPKPWPSDRTPGTPRFAPQRVERLRRDPLIEADERERVLDWQIRELEKEGRFERERFRRERRP